MNSELPKVPSIKILPGISGRSWRSRKKKAVFFFHFPDASNRNQSAWGTGDLPNRMRRFGAYDCAVSVQLLGFFRFGPKFENKADLAEKRAWAWSLLPEAVNVMVLSLKINFFGKD